MIYTLEERLGIMAVIKCTNCENEILDTEIVCPYCDCPVSTTKKDIADKREASALGGETVKIASAKDFQKEKEALLNSIGAADDAAEDAPAQEEKTGEDIGDETMKISKDDIQSDTLRRSLEERRVRRSGSSGKGGKKDHKLAILAVTVIGIFVVIYLVVGVFNKIVGEGLFEEEKGNKKAKKEVTSSAEMKELGFEFHSHTLTIIDESIVMDDYQASDEKPWKDYIKDTTNLTIGDGIETIGAHSFDDLSNVRHVTLASSVSSIGDSAFYGCSELEKLALDSEKSNLKSVGNYAFTDCSSLKTVTFGPKLKRIGEGAFKSCESLEKVVIPDSANEIGADAFLGCHNLVIVCSADSYAHEYAAANGIAVELLDDEEDEEPQETTPQSEPGHSNEAPKTNSTQPSDKSNSSENKNSTSENKGAATTEPSKGSVPSASTAEPTKSKEEKLSELMNQLGKAQSQEESDKILKEIDELTK